MSVVSYDGKKLIPAPLVSFSRDYQKTEDGQIIGANWDINIIGKTLAYKGSPDSSGTLWELSGYPPDEIIEHDSRLGSLLRKQEAIVNLFSEDGKSLEFQSADATAPVKCNPSIVNVTFSDGIWYNYFDYNIRCTANTLTVNGEIVGDLEFDNYISSASENWQVTPEESPLNTSTSLVYNVSHSLRATGKRQFDETGTLVSEAWEQAKAWVTARIGYGLPYSYLSVPANKYNHIKSEVLDETTGEYSLTESWVAADDSAKDEFEVSTSTSREDSFTTVTINGTITGFETRGDNLTTNTSKYSNASAKWSTVESLLITRAQNYSGLTVNIVPVSTNVSKSPVTGIITYSYTYNNRPSNIVSGSKSESITINDSLNTDFPVPIFVLGRANGPIIQNLATSKERSRTLNIELVMDYSAYSGASSPLTIINSNPRNRGLLDGIIDAAEPQNAYVSLVSDNAENWEITSLRYSFNRTWIWEP